MKNELLYLKISDSVKRQIKNGVLKAGDKLPSVRSMSKERMVSINTVLQAYLELEKSGLIISKAQSGYYVNYTFKSNLPLPSVSKPALEITDYNVDRIFSTVYNNNDKVKTVLSSGQIAAELLPVTRLTKELVRATKNLPFGGLRYGRHDK